MNADVLETDEPRESDRWGVPEDIGKDLLDHEISDEVEFTRDLTLDDSAL
jgi:hypothetical protein